MFKRIFIAVFFFLFLCGPALAEPQRIISLAPNITEILYSLGLEENIAGVTEYCDWPPSAKEKPNIGGMVNPSIEAILRLRADMVIMTTDGNTKEVKEKLNGLGINTYIFKPKRLFELPDGIRELGGVLKVEKRAEELASEIEKKLVSFKKTPIKRKKAVFIIWQEPIIVAAKGTTINDAIELLGWENIAKKGMTEYPRYSVEEIIRTSPDVIFINGTMTGKDMPSEKLLKKLSGTSAIKNGRVYYMGDSILRLGPRIIDAISEMQGVLKE